MNVSEASKKIGVSISKTYQLVSARKISHYRVGGKIVFTDEDIAAFLARCRVPTVEGTLAPTRTLKPKLKHLNLA